MRAADPQRHPKQNPRDKLAFWQSKALLSAVELDVFTLLARPSRRSQTPKQKSLEIPRAGPKEDSRQGRPITVECSGVAVTRLGANLGAEISGVDLRQPLSDEAFNVIQNALVEHELIIFRNQEITSDNLIDFGRQFGELTVHPFAPHDEKASVLIKFRNDENNPPFATDVWHSDETFRSEPPMATILCAKLVPAIGGDTMFASMSAAFDGLSGRMQQFISGLEAIHDWKPFKRLFDNTEEDRKNRQHFELLFPPQQHPVVR